MERIRKPFQGVWNIVRFNWHFYLLSIIALIIILFSTIYLNKKYYIYTLVLFISILIPTLVSLFVSAYVYDLSRLYTLDWLDELSIQPHSNIVNIHAGFDETSVLIQHKYSNSKLIVFDFYDPAKHTEISIQRARNAYPPYPNTQVITTAHLPLAAQVADFIFVIFAAHEIRNDAERNAFFIEIQRVMKPNGKIIIIEHLRDLPNFLAYNIGFFHFLSESTWLACFKNANLRICKKKKITSFVTTYILENHGITS
jgi:ubiquinone/menaquinone biosynthesis C-methylase UbiE